jgi:membrane protein required for colicin V production
MEIAIPFNFIDILIVIIAVISGFMASLRGLIREALGLAGWVIAVIVARLSDDLVAEQLVEHIDSEMIVSVLGFAIPFLLVAIFWYVLSNILSPPLRRFPLNILDRPLGFIYGVARGFVIAALLYMSALFAVDSEEALPNMVREAALADGLRSTTLFLASLTPETMRDEISDKIPETLIDPDQANEITDQIMQPIEDSQAPSDQDDAVGELLSDELGNLPTITDGSQ